MVESDVLKIIGSLLSFTARTFLLGDLESKKDKTRNKSFIVFYLLQID